MEKSSVSPSGVRSTPPPQKKNTYMNESIGHPASEFLGPSPNQTLTVNQPCWNPAERAGGGGGGAWFWKRISLGDSFSGKEFLWVKSPPHLPSFARKPHASGKASSTAADKGASCGASRTLFESTSGSQDMAQANLHWKVWNLKNGHMRRYAPIWRYSGQLYHRFWKLGLCCWWKLTLWLLHDGVGHRFAMFLAGECHSQEGPWGTQEAPLYLQWGGAPGGICHFWR